jgi:hypothetical protein
VFFLDRLSYRALQRLVILLVLLHNLEEALTLPICAPAIRRRLSGLAPDAFLDAIQDTSRFYNSLAAVTVVTVLVVLLASFGRPGGIRAWVVVFVQSLFLVNVFVPHVPMAIALGGYAPGVGTALLLNLPYSAYFFWRSVRDGAVSRQGLGLAVVLALPALVLILGGLYASLPEAGNR